MEKDRVVWVDYAKGIAITLVVIGHAAFPQEIRNVVYSFHMPLFFFLSGLFLCKREEQFRTFVKKKASTLVIPYIVYNLVLMAFFWIIWKVSHSPKLFEDIPHRLLGLPLAIRSETMYPSRLWFLPCLFVSELILFFLWKYLRTKRIIQIILVTILSVLCGCGVYHFFGNRAIMWSMDISLMVIPFILLAMYLRLDKCRALVKNKFIVTGSILLWIVGLFYNWGNVELYEARYGSLGWFYITSISGIVLTIAIASRLSGLKSTDIQSADRDMIVHGGGKKCALHSVLIFAGKNSLIIYCIHSIYLNVGFQAVKVIPLGKYSFFSECLKGCIIVLLTFLLCYPTIKVINRYFKWTLGVK